MSFEINDLDKLKENLQGAVQRGVNELNKGLEKFNNPEEEKPLVPSECPYCGAKLDVNSEAPVIKCSYCGTEFDNSKSRTIVDSVFDFVEKQQEIAKEEIKRKAIREEEKALKRRKRRRKASLFNFILLIILVLALLYYMQFMM